MVTAVVASSCDGQKGGVDLPNVLSDVAERRSAWQLPPSKIVEVKKDAHFADPESSSE
jgi:hypothetical protein